jgi:hypothetical protein
MSFTLDPEVAEALAPFAAETTGSTPPPVGDVAACRAALEGVFAPTGASATATGSSAADRSTSRARG